MLLILIIILISSCSQQNYHYFFEKAPIYTFGIENYLGSSTKKNKLTLQESEKNLPFSVNYFEMPFDLVLAIESEHYSMIEIINLNYQGHNLWLTLESLNDGRQVIGLPQNRHKQEIIKKFARMMKTPTYESNLTVLQDMKTTKVSFNQVNIISAKNRKYEFEIIHPKNSLEKINGILMPTNKTMKYERNSSGMNHSRSNFMAIIDIHRSLTPLETSKLKFVDRGYPKIKFKKILGTPIRTIISQNILAFGPYQHKVNKNDENLYYYNQNHELEKVELTYNKKVRSILSFSPPLKNLFSNNQNNQKYRFTAEMKTDNESENLLMLLGTIKEQKLNGEKIFYTLGVDDRLSHRSQFKRTPHWFYERSIFTQVKGKKVVSSNMLSPSINNRTYQNVYLKNPRKTRQPIFSKTKMIWKKRPHRLSKIIIDPKNEVYSLEGGTWGNGEIGSDEALIQSCQQLTKNKFQSVSTVYIPLRFNIGDTPLNSNYFDSQNGKVWGIHKLKLQSQSKITKDQLSPIIQSFQLRSGPHHQDIGVTINGINVEIIYEDKILPNGEIAEGIKLTPDKKQAEINIFIKIGIGPELTRPSKGPIRQNLKYYSALAKMDVLLVDKILEFNQDKNKIVKPNRYNLTFKEENPPSKTCRKMTKDYGMSKLSFNFKSPKKNKKETRYLRQFYLDLEKSKNTLVVDNMGEISWATEFTTEVRKAEL